MDEGHVAIGEIAVVAQSMQVHHTDRLARVTHSPGQTPAGRNSRAEIDCEFGIDMFGGRTQIRYTGRPVWQLRPTRSREWVECPIILGVLTGQWQTQLQYDGAARIWPRQTRVSDRHVDRAVATNRF